MTIEQCLLDSLIDKNRNGEFTQQVAYDYGCQIVGSKYSSKKDKLSLLEEWVKKHDPKVDEERCSLVEMNLLKNVVKPHLPEYDIELTESRSDIKALFFAKFVETLVYQDTTDAINAKEDLHPQEIWYNLVKKNIEVKKVKEDERTIDFIFAKIKKGDKFNFNRLSNNFDQTNLSPYVKEKLEEVYTLPIRKLSEHCKIYDGAREVAKFFNLEFNDRSDIYSAKKLLYKKGGSLVERLQEVESSTFEFYELEIKKARLNDQIIEHKKKADQYLAENISKNNFNQNISALEKTIRTYEGIGISPKQLFEAKKEQLRLRKIDDKRKHEQKRQNLLQKLYKSLDDGNISNTNKAIYQLRNYDLKKEDIEWKLNQIERSRFDRVDYACNVYTAGSIAGKAFNINFDVQKDMFEAKRVLECEGSLNAQYKAIERSNLSHINEVKKKRNVLRIEIKKQERERKRLLNRNWNKVDSVEDISENIKILKKLENIYMTLGTPTHKINRLKSNIKIQIDLYAKDESLGSYIFSAINPVRGFYRSYNRNKLAKRFSKEFASDNFESKNQHVANVNFIMGSVGAMMYSVLPFVYLAENLSG